MTLPHSMPERASRADDGALEIIVLSLEDALAAEAGGATRLEVVRDIHEDGLTPDVRLVESLLARVGIPLRVMVRPRNTFVVGDDAHREDIARDAAAFAQLPVDIVTGYFVRDADGRAALDEDALALVAARVPMARITVHRVVERLEVDPAAALHRHAAVDRVLSGGGSGTWALRADALARLQASIAPIRVVIGGGVTLDGIDALVQQSTLRELHIGRVARTGATFDAAVDAAIVARIRAKWA
ncbi:MAG: hypothetical protein IT182_15755 [Acidobacteria bacterium]|nr:hypothetical protein [Acidobacteriota bacterium]